jgi:cell volume regulation protein A
VSGAEPAAGPALTFAGTVVQGALGAGFALVVVPAVASSVAGPRTPRRVLPFAGTAGRRASRSRWCPRLWEGSGVEDGVILLIGGTMLLAALLASLVAGRLRVPGLLVFLAVGMIAGSDVTGWISFNDYGLAQDVGVVALALILFEGGLSSGWPEIRPVIGSALGLATIGTAVTAVVTGLAASALLDLPVLEGLLLGSIVASTDGAAVFALLRGSTLRRRLARTLEGEAGMNDPVAILLVLGFIEWIQRPEFGVVDLASLFIQQLGIGAAVGLGVGAAALAALQRLRLASAGLYPVASLAVAGVAFGGAEVLHGSGFLAVYLAGLVLGSAPSPARRTITTFHQGMGWVAQLALFLTLGLLVFPTQLGPVATDGLLLALLLLVVARPAGVLAGTALARFSLPERLTLSWAGLRGGVPVVLATFPVLEGLPNSLEFFNIVFFSVLVSTLLQGTTFETVARSLRVTTQEAALPAPLIDPATMRRFGAEVVEHPVGEGEAIVGRRVRELGLPREALLNLVLRGQEAIPPRGSTVIQAGDRLHVLVRQEAAVEFRGLLERWRSGPVGAPPRPRVPPASTVFTSGPWSPADGDPGRPDRVRGIEVVDRLRTRRDAPGAVVALADGRYAVTGEIFALGVRQAVHDAARRRLTRAGDDAETAWWREVIGALATPE